MNRIQLFGKLIKSGTDYLMDACRVYVEALDENIEARATFFETYPEISLAAWKRFEKAGRGKIHPQLIGYFCMASQRLETCPLDVQTKYLKQPFRVVKNDTVIKVPLLKLTRRQVYQVFAPGGHVRTVGQQKTYLEEQRAKVISESDKERPYKVAFGRLIVTRTHAFNKKELQRIIKEL